VNNFVTGLVRRSAGLVVPASMRAHDPAPGFASLSGNLGEGQVIAPRMTVTDADYRFGVDADQSDLVTHTSSDLTQADEPTGAVEPLVQKPSEPFAARESSPETVLTPWRELVGPVSVPSHAPGIGDSAPRSDDGSRRIVPSITPLAPSVPTREGSRVRLSPPEGAMPRITSATTESSGHEVSERAHPLFLPRHRPDEIVRSVQPVRSVAASDAVGAVNEPRGIQVKIGKVEIRSNQPAPVLRAPRSPRTSGFDDLRLSRAYLDRGTQ